MATKLEEKKTATKKETVKKENTDSDTIAILMKEIADLKKQITSDRPSEKTPTTPSNRNIKVITMLEGTSVLSTNKDPKVKSKKYIFNGFGESNLIRFNDMVDVLSNFLSCFEDGEFIIDKKQDAIDLDVEYIYEDILNFKAMQKLIKLEQYSDADTILSMSKDMQENIANIIAIKMAEGEKYDMNVVSQLEENGLKITEIANAIRGYLKDEEEEDK